MSRSKKSRSIKKPVLNEEQKALQAAIEEAQARVNAATDEYKRLRKTCKNHAFLPLTEELRNGLRNHEHWTWGADNAFCEICEKDFGWRCPDSPDTVCHYYTKESNGKLVVELVNGVELPFTKEGHKPDFETDDVCLFCGAPEERK